MEIWKDIIGFEGVYKVSNLGNIKSLRKEYRAGNHNSLRIQEERILKPYSTGRYMVVDLNNGKRNSVKVHRLVAQHFIPNPMFKKEVNHIDGNKRSNVADNLEWVTHSENVKHSYNFGLQKKKYGKELVWSKSVINLDNGVVFQTISEAAKSVNISISTLSRYLNGALKNKTSLRFV